MINLELTDLYDNPSESIERVVEATLAKREAATRKQQEEYQAQANEFNSRYPDANEIVADPEFAEWVKQSPVRLRTAQQAISNDYEAAAALIEEYRAAPKKEDEPEYIPPDTESARKAATTPVGASNASSSSGKVYRRLDLIKLKLEKPDVYGDPQFQREIMDAYATGRVR